MNNDLPDPALGAPSPFVQTAVWPPPPMTGQPQSGWAGPVCGFKWLFRRPPGKLAKKALVADYREGYLQCDEGGIIIQGKAVPRAEIRLMVLLPAIFFSPLIAIIANLVMEYGMRKDRREGVPWGSIKQIMLAPEKGQAAIVYDAYNHATQIKTYSLAFTPAPGQYEAFVQTARRCAPDRVEEGALVSATPVILWVLLAFIVLCVLGLVALALHKP